MFVFFSSRETHVELKYVLFYILAVISSREQSVRSNLPAWGFGVRLKISRSKKHVCSNRNIGHRINENMNIVQ